MSNFHPKLEDATDNELRHMVNELDFRVVPLASDELTRRVIVELNKEVKDLNKTLKSAIKSNNKISQIFLFFALVQIVIALFSFALSSHPNKWLVAGMAILLAITIVWMVRFFDPIIMKEE